MDADDAGSVPAPPARRDGSRLRQRLEPPIARAAGLTRRTLGWFPIRVWRHFLQHNGFLLAASISSQALFAIFATLYAAFAVAGLWLGGSTAAIDGLITVVNSYLPGLIVAGGPVAPEDVADIARSSGGVLAATGAAAFAVAVWTAIGFVTFARRAVRDSFGLPFDRRNFLLLKLGDLAAALLFGVALLVGASLGLIAGGIVAQVFSWLAVPYEATAVDVLGRVVSVAVGFALNTTALTVLIRFLTGTSLPWRAIVPGSALGGAALSVLQLGAGFLAVYSPTNPLLATFSVVIGFLLWLRLAGIVMLVAASWIAVAAEDAGIPLVTPAHTDRRARGTSSGTVLAPREPGRR